MKNELIPFKIIDATPKMMSIEKVTSVSFQLEITFSINNGKNDDLAIFFFEHVYSYRPTDEGYLFNLYRGNPDLFSENVFFEVKNSEYIDFFNTVTSNMFTDAGVTHYFMMTENECIDILARSVPEIILQSNFE